MRKPGDMIPTAKSRYTWMGFGLLITGSVVSVSGAFLFSALVWPSALGVVLIILALILLVLARTVTSMPPEVGMLLLETGADNIAAVVEELGVKSKAIYLPSSLTGGRVQALFPLQDRVPVPVITGTLPQRLIVKFGSGPDDIGLLVTTVGTVAVGMLESRPGPSAVELETALMSLFTGKLGAADRVNVSVANPGIRVEVRNPRIQSTRSSVHPGLDSALASVIASVAAEAWDKPLTVTAEGQQGQRYSVELEIVE